MHLRLRGRVVDDLEQAVAEDHRARRGAEVVADVEAVGIRHAHVARLQVGEHVLPALPQAVPRVSMKRRSAIGLDQR